MAIRKINHDRRVLSKKTARSSVIRFKDIIEFKYDVKDVYDKMPMVFVLSKRGQVLNGINIGYLREYIIEQILEETNPIKGAAAPKKLRSWPFCSKAFRTYKISNMSMIKKIEYETLAQRKVRLDGERIKRENEKIKRENENKL